MARKSTAVLTVLNLAFPVIIENMLQVLVGFVDTLFVSRLGLVEVAAVGAVNTILQVYMAVFMAVGVGTTVLITRSIGAKDPETAQQVAKQSVLYATFLGLIIGLLTMTFAKSILALMGADPQVTKAGALYFRIVATPSVFISLMFILSSILRGIGDTKTPMQVAFWVNIIHIILNYILIFGIFGLNGLGLPGAALATVLARLIGTGILLRKITSKQSMLSLNLRSWWRIDWGIIKAINSFGLPAGLERLSMRFGQVFYNIMIINLGTVVYAAHQLTANIEIFSYMPGYGFATAATILMGQNLGAEKPKEAHHYGKLACYLGAILMSLIGAVYFIFAEALAALFTTDPIVIRQVAVALRIVALVQPALAINLIVAGALQGAGDTKFPMYLTTIGVWLIRTVGIYLLAIKAGLGLTGVWLAIALDIIFRAVFLLYRYLSKGYFRAATSIYETLLFKKSGASL